MAKLLKIEECGGHSDDLRLERLAVQSGAELRRNGSLCELLGDSLHVSVIECAPQAIPEVVSAADRDHAFDRFIDQQVKQSIVRSGDTAAQTRLRWSSRLLAGKKTRLRQQIAVQAHVAGSDSHAPRTRTYAHRPSVSCRTRSRTMSFSRASVSASTSLRSITAQIHTAGSSVASSPVATCQSRTGVGRSTRFSRTDRIFAVVVVISIPYADLGCAGNGSSGNAAFPTQDRETDRRTTSESGNGGIEGAGSG